MALPDITRPPGRPSPRDLEGAFLYCASCGAAHRVTEDDRALLYAPERAPEPSDDLQSFFEEHGEDHDLQILHRVSDAEMHSHARWDPMRRVSWELTDGQSSFVVTFGRTSLESPRRYWVTPGRLVLDYASVELDDDLLRQEIDDAIFPHTAPGSRLNGLVETCRGLVLQLPYETFDAIDEDRDDPNVQLACLPEVTVEALRLEVWRRFDESEAEKLAELFERDLAGDIPIVRVRRHYSIHSTS